MISLSKHEGVWDRAYVEDLEAAALELRQLKARKQMDDEHPCCWRNDEGSPDGDGEMHPCCWCGSEG